ncbi:hypothetical protein B0H14DRAFT_3514141 [Mycena olivaceomarginata]|nr:hypothetical protein B0H14DRAFT_3514141 [Mycena olivaceomarginata]
MSLTFSRIAPESKDSKSPTVPTRGPLTGHYRIGEEINSVINGWPYFVLWTPSPKEYPPLDFTSRRVPHFDNPTYIDARSAYLMFIPKHDPWHGPLLGILEYTWDSFAHRGTHTRSLVFARGIISLMGNRIPPDGCPWHSPFHFGFGITRKSEHKARAAAWSARQGFLPLLGFLSMGLWCMRYHVQNKEVDMDKNSGVNLGKRKRAEGIEHIPWQVLLAQETGLHASWIDLAKTSVAGDWTAPRVGGLFHVGPTNTHNWLPAELTGLEWLLDTIIDEQPNIPLRFLPDLEEMDHLQGLPGRVTFNPWKMLGDAALPAASPSLSRPPAQLLDFPPIEKGSGQKADEWDLCSAFGADDRLDDDDPPDDNDEPVESGDVVLTDRDLVPRHDWRDPFPDDNENDTYYNERLPEVFRPTDAAEVSGHALTRIYLKATSSQDPEQEEHSAQGQPIYERITDNVLDALSLRFGFVTGHNGRAPFDTPPALIVMRLVGQEDTVSAELAAAFFAQCLQGSLPGDIAIGLFNFHKASSALH